jgi:DNA-binding CsgD family transcriptional regulator
MLSGIHRIQLAPLTVDEAVTLLDQRGVDATVATACWEATGGNPLAMLELVAALGPEERSGRAPLPDPIPVAPRIRDVFARRLRGIDDAARRALAVAAVDATGEANVIAKALPVVGADAEHLRAAEAAGFLHAEGSQLRWEHPLARAAVLDALDPADRRAAHRAVASVLDEHEHDARVVFHLAAAAEGPDEEIATRLDEIARLATSRGASSAAAVAWEAAAALSVDDAKHFERVHAGIEAHWTGGESETVVRVGRPLVEATSDPERRVRLALMVGQAVVWWEGPIAGARYLAAEGDRVVDVDPVRAATLYVYAANASLVALDPHAVIERARHAHALGTDAGDLGLPLMATAMEALGRLLLGEGRAGEELLAPLGQLCPALLSGQVEGAAPMSQVVGFAQIVTEQWDAAHALLLSVVAEAERTGYVGMEVYAHDQLSEIEWRQGRWPEAATRIAHALTLAEGHDQPVVHQGHLRQARLDACRGRTDAARASADAALEVGQRIGMLSLSIWAREVLALAALADDDGTTALRHLDALAVLMAERGVRHPGLVWWQAWHVETLAAQERTAEARTALDRLTVDATDAGGRWAAAAVARGEACLASDDRVALEHLDAAVDLLEDLGAPFELAVAQLARGERHRRLDHRGDAARDLSAARARFEHLDARPWATRADALADPSQPAPAASLASTLTDAEMRVALAVGGGATNRQAAEQLFLSIKTVDSHLQSIYRRLAITSRSQLAAIVARELGG